MSGMGEFDPPDVETEDDADQAWVVDCGDANCCMNFAPHFRHECYTPEMYEAMVADSQNDANAKSAESTHTNDGKTKS
jgi:hypothetical protein